MRRANIPLFVLMFAALALPSPAWAKQVAFVVGIDNYDNLPEAQQLRKAVNDAHALGATLRGLGYQVISADNPDRRTFNEKWQNFLSLVEPGDSTAFFFAGHGIEIGGQNYLLPRDVPKPQSAQVALIKNESLNATQLLVDLQGEGPGVSLVILDACRDNPFAESGVRSIGGTRGLARIEAPEGTFVIYSAGAGQTALDRLSDIDPDANSVFTRSLIPLINTPGLDMQEVALNVREQVVALANSVGHRQTPAYYDQLVGRFCPAGCQETTMAKSQPLQSAAALPAPSIAPSAPVPSQAIETDAAAAEAWAAARETTSVSALKAFIAKFGNSFYAELARARLTELKTKKEETKVTDVVPEAALPGRYVLQVGSKENQTEALATFAEMQQKYATLLANYRPMVQKADLGANGVWYRLRIGPIGDKETALKVCVQLKSLGHPDCLVMAAQ
jgi:Caspase domain/SPOR domain